MSEEELRQKYEVLILEIISSDPKNFDGIFYKIVDLKCKEFEQLQQENQQLRNALEKLKDSAGWREILELSGIIQERDKLQQENKQLKTLLMQDHHKIHELADVIDEVEKSLKDYQEYIEKAKKMYSDLDDDNVVKVSCMQILNNQMARNYDLLQILDKVKE